MQKWFLLLPLLAIGCAQPITKVDVPNIARSSGVVVEDLRPELEKKSEIMSLSITSEAYGMYRKGDETLDPPMVRIFQHKAFEKFGAATPNLKLKLHHMVTYLNRKSELRKGVVGGTIAGPIGAALAAPKMTSLLASEIVDAKAFEEASGPEYKRALYTEKENPDKTSVLIIYIESEINGKRVFTKTMSSIVVPEGQHPHIVAVHSAIDHHLAQF